MSLFPRFTQEFAPIFRLFDEYDRQAFRNIDRDITNTTRDLASTARTFTPKFDVKETKEAYELHGELPGIEQKDITIECTDNNTLTISGRHEHVREEGQRPAGLLGNANEQKHIKDKDGNENNADKHNLQPRVEDAPADEKGNTDTTMTKQTPGSQDVAKQPEEQQSRYWVSERSVGSFHRSFAFPARVELDNVKASLKNGVLSVVVPKVVGGKEKRRVQIE